MTGAAPTPGPYGMERRDGHARFGDRWVITAPSVDRIAVISEAGGAENPEANARLFAGSWATAAERDLLVKKNEVLTKALKFYAGAEGAAWGEKARTALLEARQS